MLEEKKKEEILKKAYEVGFGYERDYYGCCQCVIAAVQDVLDMRDDDVFKIGTGFAGGGGLMGNGTCGALCGGIIMLGYKVGRERNKLKEEEGIRYKTYELVRKLYEKFLEEFGGIHCKDIQKKVFGRSYNLLNPKEYEEFEKARGHSEKCPSVVGKATRWTVELLLDL